VRARAGKVVNPALRPLDRIVSIGAYHPATRLTGEHPQGVIAFAHDRRTSILANVRQPVEAVIIIVEVVVVRMGDACSITIRVKTLIDGTSQTTHGVCGRGHPAEAVVGVGDPGT